MQVLLEFLILATYLIPGSLVLYSAGFRGPALPALGFVTGTALFVVLSTASGIAGVSTHPGWTIAMTWCVALAGLVTSKPPRPAWRDVWCLLGFSVGALVLLTWATRAHLYTYHLDSFRYMLAAKAVASDHYDWLSANLLTKRMAAYPVLIAPAAMIGEDYLRGFAPTLALAVAWIVGWLSTAIVRCGSTLSRTLGWALTGTALALLLSTNRFLWNATYINGHLLCAAYLLTLAGSSWARAAVPQFPSRAALVLQSLSAVGLVLVRAEGALLALVALVPVVCSSASTPAERRVPLFALGFATFTWYTYVVVAAGVTGSSVGLAVLGALLMLLASCVTSPRLAPVVQHGVVFVELGLWLCLCAASLWKPRLASATIEASFENIIVGRAGWGSAASFLCLTVAALVALSRSPQRAFLRLPVTTFIPLSLLLAFLRGAPYRVAFADSFARSFIHIVPLAVVLLTTGFVAEWRRTRGGQAPRYWAFVLAIGTFINVAQFRAIQNSAEHRYRAFHHSKAPPRKYIDRGRYGASLDLARLAPGATIILPRKGKYPLDELKTELIAWGGIKELRYLDYDPQRLLPELDLKKSVLSASAKRALPRGAKPHVLIGKKVSVKTPKGKGAAREFIFLKRGAKDVFVETSLVKKQVKALGR